MEVSKTERRRSFLINMLFFAVIAALLYVVIVKAFPLFMPFLIALVVATILNKPAQKIHNRFPKVSKAIIGRLLFLLLLIIIVLIIAFAGMSIVSYVKSFAKWLSANFKHIPKYLLSIKADILKYSERFPESVRSVIENTLNKYASASMLKSIDISKILTGAVGGVWSFAKSLPSVLVSTLIAIIATFFMFGSYDEILLFIKAQLSPKHRVMASDIRSAFRDTIGNYATAYGKIILITFGEILISLYFFKLIGIFDSKYIPLIAAGIAIVDILPVLGTGTVVAPWSVISFVQGNVGFGIGLLAMWIIISIIRQYIEPKLVGKQIGLNPLLTLCGMYVGLKIFGAIGMFGFPITIIILKALQETGKIHLWNTPQEVGLAPPKQDEKVDLKEKLVEKIKSKKNAGKGE